MRYRPGWWVLHIIVMALRSTLATWRASPSSNEEGHTLKRAVSPCSGRTGAARPDTLFHGGGQAQPRHDRLRRNEVPGQHLPLYRRGSRDRPILLAEDRSVRLPP